jgi:hypothetical protein
LSLIVRPSAADRSLLEAAHRDIARTECSALAPKARPYQYLFDRILYRIAGLTDAEAQGLENRLEGML